MEHDFDLVDARLAWMREEAIWPNGLRYLWTDAFGVVLLVSLYEAREDPCYLEEAEWVVAEVERVLGRARGIRIGEAPERDGQYYHYLAMWLYALTRLGEHRSQHRDRALHLVREIHPAFVIPGRGVVWKMEEDLSAPYPGYGLGALDSFHGYVVYRLLDEDGLSAEIDQMRDLIEREFPRLRIDQDLGLGMMLWFTHFFPEEAWARTQRERSLATLEELWVEGDGRFARASGLDHVKIAFANYGVSIGLQAADAWPERVERVHAFFDRYRSGDAYDRDAITHVMACSAHFPGRLVRGWSPAGASHG